MATRARKKISRMTYQEAQAEYEKQIAGGHEMMARTIHLAKYMKGLRAAKA